MYSQCLFTVGQKCLEPKNVSKILLEHLKDMYQHPDFMLTRDFTTYETKKTSILVSQQTRGGNCEKVLQSYSSEKFLNVNQGSTCPWTVNLNVDPDRIPSSIPEAECSCDQGVQYDGECSWTKRRPCYTYKRRCDQNLSSCGIATKNETHFQFIISLKVFNRYKSFIRRSLGTTVDHICVKLQP